MPPTTRGSWGGDEEKRFRTGPEDMRLPSKPGGGPGCSGDHLESAATGRVTGLSLGPVDTGTLKCITQSHVYTVWVTIVTRREGSGQRRPPE